ncbi:MAG: NAD(P)/FAD-dependent oxidoreductase [Candidatus Micrarchaeales archaeon]|jgi:geranylgeranyl reductase family protein|uniref:Geranylgeranyl reductase n=1 Tax=Candidatus Micrarchaeum acidiphilum ARMAN-2 TaxID=425595 RepID=C7DI24_MICA2|nr:MAG: geranylgeranyl reductase [Candidatus Micrarchaeum acidiphilum ARMAN-2]MCW6160846.1 NAD(P)/FAD-dependent oxidoreductase [Candidatus Micrarchaeales archaeon]
MEKEIVIVGAGSAGLMLSIELARRGIHSTVYERKRRVDDGVEKASGILSKNGLDRMELEYRTSIINDLYGADIFAGNEKLAVMAKSVVAYVVDRKKFINLFYSAAKEAGVDVLLGRELNRETLVDMAGRGDKIIVGADGALSHVASAFGFPPIHRFVLTYKAEFDGALVEDPKKVGVYVGERYIKGFFGWMVPYGKSIAEVGIGIDSSAKKSSAVVFDSFLKNSSISNIISGSRKIAGHASIIPLEVRKKTVLGNVMLLGDAAGQVKATTGGGIIFGILCAKIAAESIAKKLGGREPLGEYERRWRALYGADLKMHNMIHSYYSFLNSIGPRNSGYFIKFLKALGVGEFLSKHGDMDSPKAMLKRVFIRK